MEWLLAVPYDSFETDGSASSLLIPLKNLINSFYSRDQSKKVCWRFMPNSWPVNTFPA